MSIFNELLQKKEENNIRLEKEADRSLINDKEGINIEEPIDDAQTAVIHILDRFGLSVDRLYGVYTLSALLDTMLDPLGMMYEYAEDVTEHIKNRSEYILAFRNDGKAITIMPTLTGYRYFCPYDSDSGLVTGRYCSQLKKGCYIFRRPLQERKSLLATFIRNVLISLTARDVFLLLAAAVLVTGLGLIIPAVSSWIYKSYIGSADHTASGFFMAVIVYIFVIVVRALISFIKTLLLSSTKIRVSMEMQSAVMAKVLHLPNSIFQDTSSGKISKRINSCVRLSDIIMDIFMDVLLNLTFSIAYLFQMRSISSALFVPAIIFIFLKILASVISALLNMVNETQLLDLDMEYTGFLYSAVRGIQKIKSLGAEVFVYSSWAKMYRKRLSLTYNQPFFLKYNTEILAGISIMTTVGLLYTALIKGLSGADYLTFTAALTLVITVVGSLTDIMENAFLVRFLCQNIYPIFAAPTEETEALEYVHSLHGSIKAEEIYFSYSDEPRGCLRGISLDIHKGEKIAIVGESGNGKSTLLKILLGMEKPDSGSVSYDGKPLTSINHKSLRRCIGSVFQFSRVFPGTIAQNIAFGNEDDPDEAKLWEAVDMAGIGDYIRSLPLKLYTEISEANSSGFSGGQRQQLLIARAVLDHPRVLILDEATSALDNVTQKKVLENIGKMNATIIMVAHRLSTVMGFDRIIMLEDGIVAEEGSYEELMAKNGKFAELVRKQVI